MVTAGRHKTRQKRKRMMFAVIKTGGKQYRVSAGDEFTVEKLVAEAGENIQFNEVLMLSGDETKVGTPLVDGAVVNAEVVDQTRGPKVLSFIQEAPPQARLEADQGSSPAPDHGADHRNPGRGRQAEGSR
jgi:ribosomal protein L21